jgi:hypothetical protein
MPSFVILQIQRSDNTKAEPLLTLPYGIKSSYITIGMPSKKTSSQIILNCFKLTYLFFIRFSFVLIANSERLEF